MMRWAAWFAWLTPAIAAAAEPVLINQIAVSPAAPDVLYAAGRPIGVLKSLDRGRTWTPARRGLQNPSAYHLALHPTDPDVLYVGTFGGGVSRSGDGAGTWAAVNSGLGNTNIHALAIDPANPRRLIASTSTGEVFQTLDEGTTWAPYGEGLPAYDGEVLSSLFFRAGLLSLGQGAVFEREARAPAWRAAGPDLAAKAVSALAVDAGGALLVGTRYGGLYREASGNRGWSPVGAEFRQDWIRTIVADPRRSGRLMVSVLGRGLFGSRDAGRSWHRLETGLPPNDDLETVVADPRDPDRLYAGTHHHGLYASTDGGRSWRPPEGIVYESVEEVIASLDRAGESPPSARRPAPPAAFAKCNQCHGWIDPVLNGKATYWRVAANRRNWAPTVARMARGAGLTPAEQREVIEFLERSTGSTPKKNP